MPCLTVHYYDTKTQNSQQVSMSPLAQVWPKIQNSVVFCPQHRQAAGGKKGAL